MKTYIYADKFFMNYGIEENGYLSIIDGKFGHFQKEKPESAEIVDFSGKYIAPGFVDTHIHGLLNSDVMDNTPEAIKTISKGLLQFGVTSFLPTTLTDSVERLDESVENIKNVYHDVEGAKIQGIFLEGPCFTEKYKGAQNKKYFINPTAEILDQWQEKSGNLVKKIAIAPEREDAVEFAEYATKNGVTVALGHSAATFDEAKRVVGAGANVFVHTYNGMSPLTHREPGMVGAAMELKNTFAELICDGHHVSPVAANIMMNAKTRENIVLITDCMRAGAMEDGQYTLGEFDVIVENGTARLLTGSLAGSVLSMNNAIKNVVDWNIATLEEAIKMASYNPAVSCNIDDKCGSIKPGLPADFVVIDDSLNVYNTYLDGVCKYSK